MSNLPIKARSKTIKELTSLILPEEVKEGSIIELILTIKDKDLNLREFAGYLSAIDGFYGRLQPEGFYSYAHKIDQQLQISEVRKGSIGLIIAQAIQTIESQTDVMQIIILWLALRCLKAIAEVVSYFSQAFKDYEEGQLAKINRKRIVEEMKRDQALQRLSPERKRQLAMLLDKLYAAEDQHLPAAIRFDQKCVIEVTIKVKQVDKMTKTTEVEKSIQ
jgi:hypothetical protein